MLVLKKTGDFPWWKSPAGSLFREILFHKLPRERITLIYLLQLLFSSLKLFSQKKEKWGSIRPILKKAQLISLRDKRRLKSFDLYFLNFNHDES